MLISSVKLDPELVNTGNSVFPCLLKHGLVVGKGMCVGEGGEDGTGEEFLGSPVTRASTF